MTEGKKIFKDLAALGSFLQKDRLSKGIKIESVAAALFIKKNIIQGFEKGSFTQDNFNNNSYLKGFLKSYIKYLKLENLCNLELLEQQKKSNLNKSNLKLETKPSKNNSYGSITILGSLILLGLIYLIWNKQTYLQLYLLGTKIN